jgi:hypothetical protein
MNAIGRLDIMRESDESRQTCGIGKATFPTLFSFSKTYLKYIHTYLTTQNYVLI